MEREFLLTVLSDMPEEAVAAILEENRKDVAAVTGEYEEKLRVAEFDAQLKEVIAGAKGRNHKAIRALLDMEALQAGADMTQAVAAVKKECGYLFEGTAVPPYASGTGTAVAPPAEPETLANALRERFGC